MAKKHLIITSCAVLLYFFLATVVISFPLILHLKEYISGLGDELLITWIMNWDIYAFFHHPLQLFQTNIFYPYHNSLTYSDAFFTNALIALVPLKLFGEPVLAFNINYLVAHTLLGFFTYLLARHLSKNSAAGVISGTLMTFSTYTVTRYVHLQVLSTEWIPLALFFFFLYIDKKQIRYVVFCAVAFVLQAANSFQPAYFLVYILVCLIIWLWIKHKKAFQLLVKKEVLYCLVAAVSLFTLLGLPYVQTSHEFKYTRDIRDTINFANRQEYFLWPSDRTRLQQLLVHTFYQTDTNPLKHDGYLGFAIIVLGLFAIVYRIVKWKKFSIPYIDLFLFIAGSAYILSLGPALQFHGHVIKLPYIIPLPYALFYYLIPGFNGFRNSARWELLIVLGLSVLIGLTFAHLFKKVSLRKVWLATSIICLLVIGEVPFPIHYSRVPLKADYPNVYGYIATLPANAAIIEMPIYNWNFLPYGMQEQMRLLYSTQHYRKMVNGTSGFSPPEWQEHIIDLYYHFPNQQTINYLKSINVAYVIVHGNEYQMLFNKNFFVNGIAPRSWESINAQIMKTKQLKLIKKIQADYIYQVI